MLYPADAKGPFKVSGYISPLEERVIGLTYRPDVWKPNQVYLQQDALDYDVVLPSVFTGFYYQVVNPGLSGAVEPTWQNLAGTITDDPDPTSSLQFMAVPYNLLLPGVNILSSSWENPISEPIWQANTLYVVNDVVQDPASGNQFTLTATADPLAIALSGATVPIWNMGTGAVTTDNQYTWTWLTRVAVLDNAAWVDGRVQVRVAEVPLSGKFDIVNITHRDNGEVISVTLQLAVGTR